MTRPGSELENGHLVPHAACQLHAQTCSGSLELTLSPAILNWPHGAVGLAVTLGSPWEPGQSWIQLLTEGTPSAPEKCPWGDSCCYPVPAPWQMGAGRGGLPSLDIALQQWLAPGGGGLHSATGSGTLASHRLNTRVSPAPWAAGTNLKSILNLGAEICEQKEEMDLCKRPGVDGRQRICHRVAKRKVSLCSAWWLT